jgi:hypothetical protein
MGVRLAVVAGVEQPDPGRELGRDIDDVLTARKQSLRQRTPDTVRALDRPGPIRPRPGVRALLRSRPGQS